MKKLLMVTMVILLSCSEDDPVKMKCIKYGNNWSMCFDFTGQCENRYSAGCNCNILIQNLADSDTTDDFEGVIASGARLGDNWATCTDYCESCYYDTITDETASTYGDSWIRCGSDSVVVINPITWIPETYRCDTLQVN